MLWRSTRDIVIETHTLVQKNTKDFGKHCETEEKKFNDIFEALGTCPESIHIKEQNGILEEVKEKVDKACNYITKSKGAKSGREEIKAEIIRFISIACLILGAIYGYSRYCNSKEAAKAEKTKITHEKIIDAKIENKTTTK